MTLLYKPIERYHAASITKFHYMSNGLTFEILIQISTNFQGRGRNTCKQRLQNFTIIYLELTEKSAKNTQRW